jgi:hypothetical protein
MTAEHIVNSLLPNNPVASTTLYEYGTLGAGGTLVAGTWSAWQQQEMLTLLYDGHGSTRALLIGIGSGSPNEGLWVTYDCVLFPS